MLKITYCLTRKAGMSREVFQAYWRETHAPLVAAAAEALGIRRYVQAHTVASPMNTSGARPGLTDADYDGVAELWWDDEASLLAGMETEEGRRHGAILAEDEANFIDFSKSRLFWSEEHEIISP